MKADPFKNNLGYNLRRASTASMSRLAGQFAKLDLRPTEASVLLVIEANPGIRQSEVGRMLGVRSANMAPLIGRMDDRGLIEREPVDGRSHGLSLNESGQEMVTAIRDEIDTHEALVRKALGDVPEEVFMTVMKRIWKLMES